MITDRELRYECLKIAATIAPGVDPRPYAEALIDYVRVGLRKAPDPRPTPAEES